MSLSQFGYSSAFPSPSSPLTSSQLLPSSSSTPTSSASPPSMSGGAPCCDKGTPLTHPHTGHTICSCQYPATGMLPYPRLSLPEPPPPVSAGYPSIPGYGAAPSQNYVPLPPETAPLYPPLNSPYDLKDAGDGWRGVGPSPGCYPYDPSSISTYPYPNTYGGVDINSAARRKNATRENTNTLKAWLYEHRKNPYPTKGEKIMLAIITKMTLTQVSTWFANARRRLKKENKMTWSPRNKPGDNDDDDNDEDEKKNDNDDSDDENNKSGSVGTSNDGRDSQSSVDVSASDCSGARGHPITTQLFDPPHQDQGSSSLGPHYGGGYDVTNNGVGLGGHTANHHHQQHQQQQQHLMSMDRSLSYGSLQHAPLHLSHHAPNTNANPPTHAYHQLPHADVQAMSAYAHHLQSQKNASLGYAHSPANQNTHSNNNISTLDAVPRMPMQLDPSPVTSSMTRPDSLCSSSNDSGLNEVPAIMSGYPGGPGGNGSAAMMDGMRPKIWSLAHEATSEGGYVNHQAGSGEGIATTPDDSDGNHLNNNKLTGYNNNNNNNNAMTPNHNGYHHNVTGNGIANGSAHDGMQQQQHQQQQQQQQQQQHLNNYDSSSLQAHHHHHHQQQHQLHNHHNQPNGTDESMMTQQQQRPALPITTTALDRYQQSIDQHHPHNHHHQQQHHHDQDFHSPPPPTNDSHPHSSSPLSPSSPPASSSQPLSSLLPPTSLHQWYPSHSGYYPPYNNSPPLHPSSHYPPPPPQSSLQSPPSLPAHLPLAPSPHLSTPYRTTSTLTPFPHNPVPTTGSDGGCEGGGVPPSPSSISSPAITPSSFTSIASSSSSSSSSTSSIPSQGYPSIQPFPNFFENSKMPQNNE